MAHEAGKEPDTGTAVAMPSSDGVISDCDELQQAFSNLSVSDLNSDQHTGTSGTLSVVSEARSPQAELLADVVELMSESVEERIQKARRGQVFFAAERRVYLVRRRDRPNDFPKMGQRQQPNPWRRFGAVRTLHNVGGWCSRSKKDKRLVHVKPNSKPPQQPNFPHFSVHHDVNVLDGALFHWNIQRQLTGHPVCVDVARQIAERCKQFPFEAHSRKGASAEAEEGLQEMPASNPARPKRGILRKAKH